MYELKPCPFCGKAARLRQVSDSYRTNPVTILNEWTVECTEGCCDVGCFESEVYQARTGEILIKKNGADDAVAAWNKRA